MMKYFIYTCFCGLLMLSNPVLSVEFDGVTLPDQVTLPGSDTPLQINGVGKRTKFVFDIYIGALYTEKKAVTRDEVQALQGPKRVLMHFVYDEVDAQKLADGWNAGFEENQSGEQMEKLAGSINRFNAMFTTVYAGDVILLDYVPGRGTVVTIRGEEQGVIEGEDFNRALLDIWLGEEPADDDLKEAMLGG